MTTEEVTASEGFSTTNMMYVVIALLAIAVGYFIYKKFFSAPSPQVSFAAPQMTPAPAKKEEEEEVEEYEDDKDD
jgi:hypothetical protein